MIDWESQLTASSLEFIDSPAMDKIEKWRGKFADMQSAGELHASYSGSHSIGTAMFK